MGVATVLVGVVVLDATVFPPDLLGGWSWLLTRILPLSILFGSALFVVRGYTLEPGTLLVQRLLWRNHIPLATLHRAWASPDALAGSIRIFGNGGLFSFSGLFRSRRLGIYRAFATDFRCAVVLELAERTIVVTPASPASFLQQLALVAPAVEVVAAPAPPTGPAPRSVEAVSTPANRRP